MTKKNLRDKTFKERYAPDLPFSPYMIHPLGRAMPVTEGFIYTQEEHRVHGHFFHRGVDFAAEYGMPVYAAAAGFAVAGYHRITVLNRDATIRTHNRKPLANGFGYFVQIFHPRKVSRVEGGRITQYGHLSQISQKINIKTTIPTKIDIIEKIHRKNEAKRENAFPKEKLIKILAQQRRLINRYPWVENYYGVSFTDDPITSESYIWTYEELKELYAMGSPWVTWVEQGQEIGKVGTSAVFFGKPPYRENQDRPNIKKFTNTWDEIHLHFEEAARDPETRLKHLHRDPYDIYKSKRWYTARHIRRSLFAAVPL